MSLPTKNDFGSAFDCTRLMGSRSSAQPAPPSAPSTIAPSAIREAKRDIPKLDMTILLTREEGPHACRPSGGHPLKRAHPGTQRMTLADTQSADQARNAYFSGLAQTCRQQLDMHSRKQRERLWLDCRRCDRLTRPDNT